MKKVVYYLLLVVFIGVFAFSAWQIVDYMLEKKESTDSTDQALEFVQVPDIPENQPEQDKENFEPERIKVDFDALTKLNDDVVAWIYGAYTHLNYPIVQGDDNDYYLYRLLDGSSNSNGTLFMDYRNDGGFTNQNTLIYGHNMKSGNMFGRLEDYKDPNYYKEHPYLYLMTPQQDYRLELFAGFVCDHDADVYSFELSQDYLASCMRRSTFTAHVELPAPDDKIVTLSTCSYEYEDARYVVMGTLTPIDKLA